eukprot:8272049-Alexandrium_andersonii.AAC.1
MCNVDGACSSDVLPSREVDCVFSTPALRWGTMIGQGQFASVFQVVLPPDAAAWSAKVLRRAQ